MAAILLLTSSLLLSWTRFPLFPILFSTALLLLWRLWTFSLKPYLYPDDPKALPYWIPFIGHGFSFLMSTNYVLDKGKKYFPNREIYVLTIFGETIYIATSPSDVTEIYRNSSNIALPETAKSLYAWNGVRASSVKKLWNAPSAENKASNPRIRAPNEMIIEYHRQQLYPGEHYEELMDGHIIPNMQAALNWENLRQDSACIRTSTDEVTISLRSWCAEIFISGLILAYTGPKLYEINPHLLKANLIWENTSWKFLYQLPWGFSRDMHAARQELNESLQAYFELPRAERADGNHFVTSVEDEMRKAGLNNNELAAIMMLHLWAITGNNYKVAFWTITHMVNSPALLSKILKEIKPAVTNGVNTKYLIEECPILDSLIDEILRVYIASAILRESNAPVIVGDKILQRNKKLLVPYRQLHFNEDIWGPQAQSFDAERFLHTKDLNKNPSYRPFGGGSTICPGRHMARRTVKSFIALLLTRFEVSVDESEKGKFPRIDETKPPLGALAPMEQDDVLLILKRLDVACISSP